MCVKPTSKGPRFVRAVCKTDGGASAPAATPRVRRRAPVTTAAAADAPCDTPPVVRVEVPVLTAPAEPRKRKRRVKDPNRCACQPGSMMRETKQGARCYDPRAQRFTKMRCAL